MFHPLSPSSPSFHIDFTLFSHCFHLFSPPCHLHFTCFHSISPSSPPCHLHFTHVSPRVFYTTNFFYQISIMEVALDFCKHIWLPQVARFRRYVLIPTWKWNFAKWNRFLHKFTTVDGKHCYYNNHYHYHYC